MERQLRVSQHAEQLQAKVVAKLTRLKKRRELFFGAQSERSIVGSADDRMMHSQANDLAKVDAKATLLSEFFKEMAAYQPSQQALRDEQTQRVLAVKKEEELLETFADFFESDMALQNLLNQEKWVSPEDKAAKRKARTSNAALQSHQMSTESTTLTSEDYVRTAQYIEELMREVSREEEEDGSRSARVKRVLSPHSEATKADQLSISWAYAQRRTQGRSTGARTPMTRDHTEGKQEEVPESVEQTRRDEWMKSAYIQELGVSEQASRVQYSALRAPFIPSRQSFHDQEERLPWQPIWEVPVASPAIEVEPQLSWEKRSADPSQNRLRSPHRAPTRPKTAVGSGTTSSCSTASHSAAFSYQNSRRIRSAQQARYPSTSSTKSPALTTADASSSSAPRRPQLPATPRLSKDNAASNDDAEATFTMTNMTSSSHPVKQQPRGDGDQRSPEHTTAKEGAKQTNTVPASDSIRVVTPCSQATTQHPKRETTARATTVEAADAAARQISSQARKKKKKTRQGSKASGTDKRFALQVQELLAVTAVVRESEQTEASSAS